MNVKEYLDKSYTCYHAVENGISMLKAAGFKELVGDKSVSAAKGYYRAIGGTLFAAKKGGEKLALILSHTDSPSLRIRYGGAGGINASSETLDVEKYGGGLLRSFLDRKLKVAGRMIVKEGDALVSRNVVSQFNLVIPSVAVHLGGGEEQLVVSRDLRPLLGKCGELYKALGYADALDADLFCVPAEESFYAGANGEYLCSPRIDNLVSAYASLRAITDCDNKSSCVIACFNNEETGSETREGAQSRLLKEFIADFFAAVGQKKSVSAALSEAFAFSCDGAHVLHPVHKEKYSDNAPVAGGGIVIKRNDRYATDALTAAAAREIFAEADVDSQVYFHNPDLRCGSTVGLAFSHLTGAAVCDIGVGQFAMHSALETAAASDMDSLVKALTRFFSIEADVQNNKIRILK